MTNEDLKIWFINKINSTYKVEKDNSIYYIYDEQFNRQRKLNRILGKDISLPKNHNGKTIYFEQDSKNEWFWVNYEEIWLFFYDQKVGNYFAVQEFIKSILEIDLKMKVGTPIQILTIQESELEIDLKMKVGTPNHFTIGD